MMGTRRITAAKLKLHGRYRAPRFRVGAKVNCAVRGELRIVGVTDARIPWPMGVGPRGGPKSLVVFGDLVRAVQRESVYALCHWFGVNYQTVTKWRKALGVPECNEGTRRLWEANAAAGSFWRGVRAAKANSSDPFRRARHAAARRGKRHSAASIEKTRRGLLGRKHSAATRRKLVEAWKRRRLGQRKPAGGHWKAWEDDLVRSAPIREVMRWTGRTKECRAMAATCALTRKGGRAVSDEHVTQWRR
jgi:hypothetical protein